MALPAAVDAQDQIPAGAEEHYVERADGTFALEVNSSHGLSLEDTGNLKKTLQKERRDRDDLSKKLRKFEGIDADEARAALEQIGELREKAELNEDQEAALKVLEQQLREKYDGERTKLVNKFETDLSASSEKNQNLFRKLQSAMIDATAAQAITEAGGEPALLMPIIRSNSRVVESDDGDYRVEVLDDTGTPRISMRAGSTELMGISEFVGELRNDKVYARAFSSSGAEGSAATPSSRSASSSGGTVTISANDAQDPHLYRAAKAKAAETGRSLEVVSE